MAPVIETADLTRAFDGTIAVDGLSFSAEPGEVVALLGPNGAGKTTTVRLLNGVLRPDRGSARVAGLDPTTDGGEIRRRTGVLTENAGLDERLTARENLEAVARIRGFDDRDARARVGGLLERFAMADRADDRVRGFSTGQRKRLALARALLHDPDILFLDEPTSGLDPEATRDVVHLIATLATEHGRTVLLCTHFLGEAGRLAHRMAVLHRGRLEAFGRPADLAAELWHGVRVDLDLGAAAGGDTIALLRGVRGVFDVEVSGPGATVHVEAPDVVPALVAALVARDLPVFAATPRQPTIEDVYFALRERHAGEPGELGATIDGSWPMSPAQP